jgi:hypothetical protein
MRRELAHAGCSEPQIETLIGHLHVQLRALRPEFRASGAFLRYVEMVEAMVRLNGAGPNYRQWHRDVSALARRWKKPYQPLDQHIQPILDDAYVSAAAGEGRRYAG